MMNGCKFKHKNNKKKNPQNKLKIRSFSIINQIFKKIAILIKFNKNKSKSKQNKIKTK